MNSADRRKWDARWATMPAGPFDPHPLLVDHQERLVGGLALDLACGRGQNAIWLAECGYKVLAVDLSSVALEVGGKEARRAGLGNRLLFVQVNLDQWQPPPEAFNLVCVFRFLDRGLFPAIAAALKPGGLLFYFTRHEGVLDRLPDATRSFLLARGELKNAFPQLETLHFYEDEENAALVAIRV